jgi:hypothetical protein
VLKELPMEFAVEAQKLLATCTFVRAAMNAQRKARGEAEIAAVGVPQEIARDRTWCSSDGP